MDSRSDFLGTISLFASMDNDERAALAAVMAEARVEAGSTIYETGAPGGSMHVILEGRVEISLKDGDGEKLVLDVLGPGAFFGELSLLDGGVRSATVVALEDMASLVLARADLLRLLVDRPHMAQDMMMALVQIIRRTDSLLRQRVSRNPNEVYEEQETLGTRVADVVARFGGSWFFIFSFGVVLATWVLLNTVFMNKEPFDAYPFILLNLFLSMIAALQAPVIMMSQNRQDAKDRIRSELDYQVNLKAELGVSELLRRVAVMEEHMQAIRHPPGPRDPS